MRLHDREYRELIVAARERLAAMTDAKARDYLASGLRKLEQSAARKQANNTTASRRGAIRTGAQT